MPKSAKKAPGKGQLSRARVLALHKECADLLESDLKDAEATCLRRHCRRIWERMDAEEREAMRKELIKDHKTIDTSLIEFYGVSAIAEQLKRAGKLAAK